MTAPLKNQPYGLDTSCTDFLRPGVLVTGGRLVAEACYRRLITSKGQLKSDPDYGFCVADLLQRGMSAAELAQIGPQIEAELSKDERLDDVVVTVDVDTTGPSLALTIESVGTLSDGSTFTLALQVSDVTTTIFNLQVSS